MVVAAILKSTRDRRSDSIYRQFSESIDLERNATADGYAVKPASTTSDLIVELEGNVVSNWVRCHDVRTGQPLEFRSRSDAPASSVRWTGRRALLTRDQAANHPATSKTTWVLCEV